MAMFPMLKNKTRTRLSDLPILSEEAMTARDNYRKQIADNDRLALQHRAERLEAALREALEWGDRQNRALIGLMSQVQLHHGKDHLREPWGYAVEALALKRPGQEK